MKIQKKRGMAAVLAAVLAVNFCVFPAIADDASEDAAVMAVEETVPETEKKAAETPEAPATEAKETEPPATEPKATEPPATEPPATEPPATEPPATEPPATEPPATEPPATEPAATEPPATEPPVTDEPETNEETDEPETETEESGIYTWEDKKLTVEIALPDKIALPENAVLKVKAEKKDSDTCKDSIALVEKAESELYFGEYKVYDIFFEADGNRLDLKNYTGGEVIEKNDIEVVLTFTEPAFKDCDVKNETVKVYHIKDLTEEELARAREEAEKQKADEELTDETNTESGSTPQTEMDEKKAVEVKSTVEMTKEEMAVSAITFYTDGFSNYVLAVTGDAPETEETQQTSETAESGDIPETEETQQISETTENETAQETTENLQTETAPAMPVAEDTMDAKQKLTLYAGQVGNAGRADLKVTLTPDSGAAGLENVQLESTSSGAKLSAKDGKLEVTIPAAASGGQVGITLLNLPDGAYTVDAGGAVSIENAAGNGIEYTSLYCVNGEKPDGKIYYNAPQKITINSTVSGSDPSASQGTANQTVEIYNVYNTVNLELLDKESGRTLTKTGGTYELSGTFGEQGSKKAMSGGKAVIKGLPIGTVTVQGTGDLLSGKLTGGNGYSWKMAGVPDGYVSDIQKTASFEFVKNGKMETDVLSQMEAEPTVVKLQAKDSAGADVSKVAMKVKDETTDETWTQIYESGQTVKGMFVVGHKYTITQTARPQGYIIKKDSYSLEIENRGTQQGVKAEEHTVNKPIVVTLKVVDGNGDEVSGGSVRIVTSDNKRVGEVVSSGRTHSLSKPNLEPGKTYYLEEVSAPNGHYASTKKVKFKLDADGEAKVTLKYVTTKLVFTRYAYNYVTKDKNGKLEYHDRKPLEGAVFVLRDAGGNEVDRWTTTENAYVCEGKLNVGEKYTLVEVSTPEGYATPAEFTVNTELGEEVQGRKISINADGYIRPYTNVAVQATRYGSIEVAKRVAFQGEAKKLTESRTFHCGIFKDSECTKLYKEMDIVMMPDDVFAANTFTNVTPGTYYLAETDGNGNRIDGQNGEDVFQATVAGNPLTVTGGTKANGNILNNYTKLGSGSEMADLSDSERTAWNDVPASYSGTTDEDGNAVTATNAKTNDPTKFIPYILMVIAALAAIIGVVVYKKKK